MNRGLLRIRLVRLSTALALIAPGALAQDLAGPLTSDQLHTLFRGSTWAVEFGGASNFMPIWDFNADWSLCGRLRGAKAGTRCADTGKWRLQGDLICWDFTWLGETDNYKSVCARAHKVDETTYVLTDQSGKFPPVPFHPVKQSN
jgi:hypothetical protein